jgi:hypothetical protein
VKFVTFVRHYDGMDDVAAVRGLRIEVNDR